ncbi:MAG: PAS domain S-box protein [Candidatus Aegiribacteria sp.]|nr:PAS domain S-box protein [Candidatus Aegiribacteria sp.]
MSKKDRSAKSFSESDVLLQAFLDHFPGAAFLRDTNSKYLHVNQYFMNVFGPEEKWVGKTPDLLFPDDYAHRMIEEDEKTLKDGCSVYEKKVLLENSREATFEVHSFRIDRDGKEPLIGGIAIDITDWHNSKEALRKSEERYRVVFQNTGTATAIVDNNMTILLVNRGFERLSGYSADEICGKMKWTEFVAPADLERMVKHHTDECNKERSSPNEYEFQMIDRNNNLKDLHLNVDLMPGTSTSICSFLDISELKNTQEKLRQSVRNMESLLRTMPDIMFVLTRDGEYVDFWAEDDSELAIPQDTIIGSNINELGFDKEKLQEILDCLTKALETGEVQSVEYELEIGSRYRFFEARLAPYADESVMAVVRDITARKNAENERFELQARVQHAQKLESLGVLAGGIAHDFNNILMAILGNADLALMAIPETSSARGSLNNIVNAATTAADLTRQMLAYSGKSDFEILPLDLNKVVVELTHLLEVSISKKAILKFRLADKLPLIMADAAQIRQILMNLITNASEAIASASGVISITTGALYCDSAYLHTTELTSEIGEDMYVYVEVSDTGSGMGRSVKEQLFEPFFTTKQAGRGLGLSSVLGIIRSHKGAIKVYSELGEGTSVKILFPAHQTTDSDSLHSGEGTGEDVWTGEGVVLFADDEDTVLAVGRNMLEHLGFTVLSAEDGLQAVDLFRRNAGDIVLVILDLTMPHLSGDEVYREIRRIRDDVPVIISSGFSRKDVMHRFAGKHLAGFLQKPYRMQDLSDVITDVFTVMDDNLSE